MLPRHILISLALFLTASAAPVPSPQDAISTLTQDIGSAVSDLSANGNGNAAGNGNKDNGDDNGSGDGNDNGSGNSAGNGNTIGSISLKRQSITDILGSAVGDLSGNGNSNSAGNNNEGNGDGNGDDDGNGNGDNNSAGNDNTIGSIEIKKVRDLTSYVENLVSAASAVDDLSGNGNNDTAGSKNSDNGDNNGNNDGNDNGSNNSVGNNNSILSNDPVRRQDVGQQLENSLAGQIGTQTADDLLTLAANGPGSAAGVVVGALTGNDGTSSTKKRQPPLQGELGDEFAELLGGVPKE